MSIAENRAASRHFFEQSGAGGDLAAARELFVPDYRHHDPQLPPQMQEGRDAYIGHLPMFTAAFPDMRMTIKNMVAEDDRVATHWSFTGTHNGELMGIPPTGKQVTASGISIQRFADGKIAEGWTNFDLLGLLQQLGVVPSPG
jgi:steroid delta-isomerase-like uncharacterized protein